MTMAMAMPIMLTMADYNCDESGDDDDYDDGEISRDVGDDGNDDDDDDDAGLPLRC